MMGTLVVKRLIKRPVKRLYLIKHVQNELKATIESGIPDLKEKQPLWLI